MNYDKAPFPWFGTVDVRADGSIWRIRSNGAPCAPRRIDRPDASKGYRNVRLPSEDDPRRWRTYKAHRLVWWWHHGPIPVGLQINHIDLNRSNNAIGNLELSTPSENIRHSYVNGRTRPHSHVDTWRGVPRRDTEQHVATAARMRQDGRTLREIADTLECSVSHAHRLVKKGGTT